MSLWTLNGDLIVEQNIFVEGDDTMSSCAFYEGTGDEYLERNLIFTGHKKGVVNVSLRGACSLYCIGTDSLHRFGIQSYPRVLLFLSM